MEYLKIKNWDKWQSYRADRGQPPWIKVHRRIMRNIEWVSLTDDERGQLVAMWLLAADHDGVIPASPEIIQKLCFMTKAPDLNKFTELGFIEDGWRQRDVNATSTCSIGDSPKAKAKAKAKAEKRQKKAQFIPPSLNEVVSFFKEKGYSESAANRAFNHYSLADWHDTTGKPVKNWKQKMNTVWFKPENIDQSAGVYDTSGDDADIYNQPSIEEQIS